MVDLGGALVDLGGSFVGVARERPRWVSSRPRWVFCGELGCASRRLTTTTTAGL